MFNFYEIPNIHLKFDPLYFKSERAWPRLTTSKVSKRALHPSPNIVSQARGLLHLVSQQWCTTNCKTTVQQRLVLLRLHLQLLAQMLLLLIRSWWWCAMISYIAAIMNLMVLILVFNCIHQWYNFIIYLWHLKITLDYIANPTVHARHCFGCT